MVGGIWGQTRSYGDTYHWAFHDGTVESLSAVPVFFFRRREPGAGDEVEADISQPGGAELSDQRANAPRLCASGNFGSGYAGLPILRNRSYLRKIFRLRVCSIYQYLLLWQRGVRSQQCGLWSVILDNLR
jgi:hypothetical protein